jgi:putative SOS response-associated peptidase YedK
MCGRYVVLAPPRELEEVFGVAVPDDVQPRWNIAPTQDVGIVRVENGMRRWATVGWGLVPAWSRAFWSGPINARIESVAEKPTFRDAFRRRRCLIPASAWYEWTQEGRARQPWLMEPDDGRPVAFAGIWEAWGEGPARRETVAFLTTEATGLPAEVHHRMPVLLAREAWDAWLEPGTTDPAVVLAVAGRAPATGVTPRRVGRTVNRAGAEGPECVADGDEPGGQLGLFG